MEMYWEHLSPDSLVKYKQSHKYNELAAEAYLTGKLDNRVYYQQKEVDLLVKILEVEEVDILETIVDHNGQPQGQMLLSIRVEELIEELNKEKNNE